MDGFDAFAPLLLGDNDMIEDLAQAGRATADRLVLADALVCDYVKLIASDGADVTRDLTVISDRNDLGLRPRARGGGGCG